MEVYSKYQVEMSVEDDTGFSIQQDSSELEELQRQVMDLQEDLQMRQAQEAAAREEGQRKSTGAAAGANSAKATSVFVSGCDPKTTENDLKLFFSGCGAIRRVTILKDRFTGQPRGICYVEFETEDAMNSAVTKDGQSMYGKPLKVAIKRDNVPAGQRGGAAGPGQFPAMPFPQRGMGAPFRGGRGAANPAMQMQQQMMAGMMMMMGAGGGAMPFSPYGAPRGRGRGAPMGGRGAGRGY